MCVSSIKKSTNMTGVTNINMKNSMEDNSLTWKKMNETGEDELFYDSSLRQRSTFDVMNDLRKQNLFCDVILKSGDSVGDFGRIQAHRVVLAATSSYFKAMFMNFKEREDSTIELIDMDQSILEVLIDFLYTSKVHINEGNVQRLLPAADFLDLDGVRDACCIFLQAQLHPSNCLGIRNFAETHACLALESYAELYIRENFEEIVKEEEFLDLPLERFQKLISSDSLVVSSEEKVFESVMTWINDNSRDRQIFLAELMKFVRLPLIQLKYIFQTIERIQLFMTNHQCYNFLEEASAFHLFGKIRGDQTSFNDRRQTISRRFLRNVILAVGNCEERSSGRRRMVCYDTKNRKWYPVTYFPARIQDAAVTVVGDNIYILGGVRESENEGEKRIENTVDVYNVHTQQWTKKSPMTQNRSSHGVGVIGDCIYVVGGYDGEKCLDSVEVYDTKTDEWRTIPSMSRGRKLLGVGVVNDCLYALGGFDDRARRFLAGVECYDPKINKWKPVAPMPTQKIGVGVGVLNGKIYAVGGFDGRHPSKIVESYNPITNEWKSAARVSFSRENAGMVAADGMLYAVGGEVIHHNNTSEENLSGGVEIYSLIQNTWHLSPGGVPTHSYKETFTGIAYMAIPVVNEVLNRSPHGLRNC